jgi:hypothetical protein
MTITTTTTTTTTEAIAAATTHDMSRMAEKVKAEEAKAQVAAHI